jgi:chromosome segregation ATPase
MDAVDSLRDELAEVVIERDSLSLELSDLRKENEDLRNRLQLSFARSVQNDFFDDLRRQLDRLTEENGILSCQTRTLRDELSATKSENVSLSDSIASLSATNSGQEKAIAQLSGQIGAWKAVFCDPETLRKELEARLSVLDSAKLRAQVRAMEAELAQTKKDCQTSILAGEAENSRLRLQLHEVELLIGNQGKAAEEYVAVKAQNEKMNAQMRMWHVKMQEVLQQNGTLIAQLQATEEKDKRSVEFEIENIRLTDQLQSAVETLQLREGQISEFRAMLDEEEQKNAILMSKLSMVHDENRRLNDINEELVNTLEKQLDLQAMEGDEQGAVQSRMALLEELNAELQKTIQSRAAESERISTLEVSLRERDAELAGARQENTELNAMCELSALQIASVQTAVTDIHKTLAVLSSEKEALVDAGEAMKTTIQEIERENEELRNRVEELEAMAEVPFIDDTDELVNENRTLQQQLRALKRDTASVVSYRSRVESLSREVEQLRARLIEPKEAIEVECSDEESPAGPSVVKEIVEDDPDFTEITETDQASTELAEARQATAVISQLLNDELAVNARVVKQLEESEKEKEELRSRVGELSADVLRLKRQVETLLRENAAQKEKILEFEAAGDVCANHLTEVNRILAASRGEMAPS